MPAIPGESPDELLVPADWAQWSNTRPQLIKPLPGGLTNNNYLLRDGERLLVLRLNSAISAALDLDREAELQTLCLADAAGLSAPLIYSDPQRQYLVSGFIRGRPWAAADRTALTGLADLLKAIHQLPAIANKLDVRHKQLHYWQAIDPRLACYGELTACRARFSHYLDHASPDVGQACLCHNDLLPDNLLWDEKGQLRAIDWEYAAMGDPFYDLAVIVEGHGFSTGQQQQLLAAYLQAAPGRADWQRLHYWRIVYRYLSLLWYAVQVSAGVLSDDELAAGLSSQIQALNKAISHDLVLI